MVMALVSGGKAIRSAATSSDKGEGKENICPDGGKGLVGSPLPEGYPRKPLQDITKVLAAGNKGEDVDGNTCSRQSKKGKCAPTLRVRKETAATRATATCKNKKCGRSKTTNVEEQVVILTKSNSHQVEGKSEESPTVETVNDTKQVEVKTTSTHTEDKREQSPLKKRKRSHGKVAKPPSNSILKLR